MTEEFEPLKEVKALLKEMEKSSDEMILNAARTDGTPLVNRLTLPREFTRLVFLVKNLLIFSRGQYEIDETLLKAVFSLKTMIDELKKSPTPEKIKELSERVDKLGQDVDDVVKPIKEAVDRATREYQEGIGKPDKGGHPGVT